MKLVVYHASYGCDTGCCGHVIEDVDDEGSKAFVFSHPRMFNGSHLEWAQQLVAKEYGEEHVKDLDWENCLVSSD